MLYVERDSTPQGPAGRRSCLGFFGDPGPVVDLSEIDFAAFYERSGDDDQHATGAGQGCPRGGLRDPPDPLAIRPKSPARPV